MATKKQPIIKPETRTFRITSDKVGKMLGPYKIAGDGDNRTVVLSDRQAKFYLDQGVIEEA